jgi:hypothetical protein
VTKHTAALGLGILLVAPLLGSPAAEARCRRPERTLARLDARVAECTAGTRTRGCDRLAARLAKQTRRITDRCVDLNQVQVLGTHNSYHVQARPSVLAALLAVSSFFETLEYTHIPLDQQFETQGIRQIELDVFADPEGSLYSARGALLALGEPEPSPPELDEPGIKVLHLQDIDFETTCLTFVQCLQTVKAWSDAHPRHLPLMILVEAKDDRLPDFGGVHFAVPIPWDGPQFDALDAEIRSVFPPSQLITPDDIRGRHATLEEAVLTDGWPTLGDARGKILFTLDNEGKRVTYRRGHASLEGLPIFTNATPGEPDAAFVKANDPIADAARIPDLVRSGYIVRTRADADTLQARSGDTTQREAALASGAQFVSTDYPVPNPAFGTGYQVMIPDGSPGRCNPVNAPAACRSAALETP